MTSHPGEADHPLPKSPLRIGVLGCADIAERRILPTLAELDSAELVAVSSRDPDKAQRFASRFGCAAVCGYHELLAREDVDAVYLPLPPAVHYRWIVESLNAGKHVLAEKPMCVDPAETAAALELARERDLVLVENFMFLHHSQHSIVQALVRDGAIGRVQAFHSSFGIPPVIPSSYRYRPELGGGALLDVGVYPVRAAQLHLPGELCVVGAHRRTRPDIGVDVAGGALLAAPDGAIAHLSYGFEHSYRSDYLLWGSAGRITVPWAFTPPAQHTAVIHLERKRRVTELTVAPEDQVRNALRVFVDSALGRTGRPADQPMIRNAVLVADVANASHIRGNG